MIPCSSCGYQFDKSQLREIAHGSYCRVCIAIGGSRVNQNPHQFGDARYFLPALAYCTNLLMAAVSTRAEAVASKPTQEVFIVVSSLDPTQEAALVEIQDGEGRPVASPLIREIRVAGTDFRKYGPFLVPKGIA